MKRIALKVQRRRFTSEAAREIAVHQNLRGRVGSCPEIIGLREAFLHDGHVCMVFERHGDSLHAALERGALRPAVVQRATGQILRALDHLHRGGYAHTDIKPDNILYEARTGDARLADLGDVQSRLRQGTLYGTREYTPPEVLLGAPLSPALDLWSLGCTVFEMLTGQLLFDPRAAAGEKYQEFSNSADGKELPLAAAVLKDQAEEEAEQLARRRIVAGKYRLQRALGCGRFSTVWAAEQLHDRSLDDSSAIARNGNAEMLRRRRTPRQRRDRKWRRQKGAADLLDLALNYEQLLLIAAICGPFPESMTGSARYRASYFAEDGAFRFHPELRSASLQRRLRRIGLTGAALELASDFLCACLTIDPAQRITAARALAHPWLTLPNESPSA